MWAALQSAMRDEGTTRSIERDTFRRVLGVARPYRRTIAAFLAFTAGELLFMPITAIIPVRLAPMHLRGRYFSLSSVVWGGSYAFASLVGGLALDLPNPAILWPVMTMLMLAGGIGALRLGRSERLNPVEQPVATPA